MIIPYGIQEYLLQENIFTTLQAIKQKGKTDMAKKTTRMDQIEEAVENFKTKVKENIRTIVAAFTLILIISAIVTGVVIKNIKDEEKASALFSNALTVLSKAEQENNPEAFLKTYSLLNDIINKYPSSRSARAAYFHAGVCSFRLGKYDTAISEFETFLKKAGREVKTFRSLAYENIGYAYEQKGEYEKALSSFQKQKNEKLNINPLTTVYNIARSYENLGDREKACLHYEDFLQAESAGSVFAEIAKTKIETFCSS